MPSPDAIFVPITIPDSLEIAFQLRVNSLLWDPRVSLTKGTTYKDFKMGSELDKPRLNEGFSALKLQTCESTAAPDPEDPTPWLAFTFSAAKTTEQANTAVDTWYAQERLHWPRELLLLKFYVVDGGTQYPTWDAHTSWSAAGVVEAEGETKMVPQKRIRESYTGLTTVKYERFVSPVHWTDTFLATDGNAVPQPGFVDWNLPGTRGEEADVLHNGVFIPRSYFVLVGGYGQDADYGYPIVGSPTPTVVSSIPSKNYAATNHTIWTTHTASNEVKAKGYYYERLKVTAYAPPRPTIWT